MTEDSASPGRQTVLQGVAFATVLNVVSRFVILARQMVITASFGLTGVLDSFYAALSYLTVVLVVLDDVFDSVVVPALVRRNLESGRTGMLDLAAAAFRRTLRINGGLVVLVLLLAPLAPWLVPGLAPASKRGMVEDIFLLAPYAMVYLPYACLGAFVRSQRRFHVFFTAELVVAIVALAALLGFRHEPRALALSLSVAQVAGLATLLLWARWKLSFRLAGPPVDLREVVAGAIAMLPVLASSQLLILIDRFYASFLGEGNLAALWYGLMLVSVLPWLFGTQNTLVASFAESTERGALLARFTSGALLLATPLALFAMLAPAPLVGLAFGRGAFDAAAVAATAQAFRWYALGLPALFLWPACVRMLQVVGRYDAVRWLALAAVLLNALLGGVAVFVLDLGVAGLAAATSFVQLLLVPLALGVLARHGIVVPLRESLEVLPAVALAAGSAAALVFLGPLVSAPILTRAAIFVVVYVLVAIAVPSRERDRVGEMVVYSFPRLGAFWPRRRGAG